MTMRGAMRNPGRGLMTGAMALAAMLAVVPHAHAFWLLGFSTADTLPPGGVSAIAGTGGQFSAVGDPSKDSYTPFLPHAGFRIGVWDGFDIGYRLTQTPLPYSSVGPTLGGEIDGKFRLTAPGPGWQAALVLGGALAYLQVAGQSKTAWSPGVDLMFSHPITPSTTLITELRYVYTAIPTGPGGSGSNNVQAAGADLGARFTLTKMVSLVPEVGLFDLNGQLAGRRANGIAAQYGAVLAFRLW